MTDTEVEKIEVELFQGESFFRDITREDGLVFDATTTGEASSRDNLGETLHTMTMDKSSDSKAFELRFLETSEWQVGKKYQILARLKDSVSSYNDVVLLVTCTIL